MKAIAYTLIAIAGFAATAGALRIVQPVPNAGMLRIKYEYWLEHKDEYDLIFIGSSRVMKAFDGAKFDAAVAQHGVPIHSYNFGVQGMRSIECDLMLDRVLAARPARLKYVLIEFPQFGWELDEGAVFTDRAAFWHTPGGTATVLHSVFKSTQTFMRKSTLAAQHLALMFANITNYGMTCGSVFRGDELVLSPPIDEALVQDDGYVPTEVVRDNPEAQERATSLVEKQVMETWRTRLSRMYDHLEPVWFNMEAFSSQVAKLDAADVVVVYVTIPAGMIWTAAHVLKARGTVPNLLTIDDPRSRPQLWESRLFSDPGHFNEDGAALFSAALAEAFLAEVKR